MIIYDFDDTIYDGDSSTDFYKYCFSKKPISALLSIISTLFWVPLYMFKYKTHRELKEKIFHFVTKFNNLEELVEDFWDINQNKIKKWYLDQQHKDDVIISASFDFIIKPICYRLNIKNILATDYDLKNGKIIGPNCHGRFKIIKFETAFPNKKIKKAYSDSSFDIPILEYAEEGYVVIGSKILPYEGHVFDKKLINYAFDMNLLSSLLSSFISGIFLIVITWLLYMLMNIIFSFSIGYFLSIILLYLLGLKFVYKDNFNIKCVLEFVLYSIPHFLLFICFIYLVGVELNVSMIIVLMICLVAYVPSLSLIIKLFDEKGKGEKKDEN